MRATILDAAALKAVSPAALKAYARAAGWRQAEAYGDYSYVYVARGRPEIILPSIPDLGDYANIVSRLVEIFADAAETDELSLYRDLVTADRDVVRVRAGEESDGTIAVDDGLALFRGTRELVRAAAYSLWSPRPLYRADSNREAVKHVQGFYLGQTEQGSFTVTLLTPVVEPPVQRLLLEDDPVERQMKDLKVMPRSSKGLVLEDDPVERRITKRLTGALTAAREAARAAIEPTSEMVEEGVSVNLCEALVKLIQPFSILDVSVTWARTLPRQTARETVHFSQDDVLSLQELGQSFRNVELRRNEPVTGNVYQLKRPKANAPGNIALQASIDEQNQLVEARLEPSDYEQAIQAHQAKAPISMKGDLERIGKQRWRLLNPHVVNVISNDGEADDR